MSWSREDISMITGFDLGDKFQDAEDVIAYFKVAEMESMYDGAWQSETDLNQDDLDEMAYLVIENQWHMEQKP